MKKMKSVLLVALCLNLGMPSLAFADNLNSISETKGDTTETTGVSTENSSNATLPSSASAADSTGSTTDETKTVVSETKPSTTQESSSQTVIEETTESTTETTTSSEEPQAAPQLSTLSRAMDLSLSINYQGSGWKEGWTLDKTIGDPNAKTGINALKSVSEDDVLKSALQYKGKLIGADWSSYVTNGELLGNEKAANGFEGLAFKLSNSYEKEFKLYYRVHNAEMGWLDWASAGQQAGSEGFSYAINAIDIKLLPIDQEFTGSTDAPYIKEAGVKAAYQTHV